MGNEASCEGPRPQGTVDPNSALHDSYLRIKKEHEAEQERLARTNQKPPQPLQFGGTVQEVQFSGTSTQTNWHQVQNSHTKTHLEHFHQGKSVEERKGHSISWLDSDVGSVLPVHRGIEAKPHKKEYVAPELPHTKSVLIEPKPNQDLKHHEVVKVAPRMPPKLEEREVKFVEKKWEAHPVRTLQSQPVATVRAPARRELNDALHKPRLPEIEQNRKPTVHYQAPIPPKLNFSDEPAAKPKSTHAINQRPDERYTPSYVKTEADVPRMEVRRKLTWYEKLKIEMSRPRVEQIHSVEAKEKAWTTKMSEDFSAFWGGEEPLARKKPLMNKPLSRSQEVSKYISELGSGREESDDFLPQHLLDKEAKLGTGDSYSDRMVKDYRYVFGDNQHKVIGTAHTYVGPELMDQQKLAKQKGKASDVSFTEEISALGKNFFHSRELSHEHLPKPMLKKTPQHRYYATEDSLPQMLQEEYEYLFGEKSDKLLGSTTTAGSYDPDPLAPVRQTNKKEAELSLKKSMTEAYETFVEGGRRYDPDMLPEHNLRNPAWVKGTQIDEFHDDSHITVAQELGAVFGGADGISGDYVAITSTAVRAHADRVKDSAAFKKTVSPPSLSTYREMVKDLSAPVPDVHDTTRDNDHAAAKHPIFGEHSSAMQHYNQRKQARVHEHSFADEIRNITSGTALNPASGHAFEQEVTVKQPRELQAEHRSTTIGDQPKSSSMRLN